MKKNLFAFIAVLGLVGLFSACSSDDNNDSAPVTVVYDGVYQGDLDVSMNGLKLQVQDRIEIVKTGDNRATLQLKNFSFEGLEIGDIIVDNVKVSSKNKAVKLTGEARIDLIVGDCAVTVDATVTGDNMVATIDVVATPPLNDDGTQSADMEIKVTFKGVRTDIVASSKAEIISFDLKDIEATSTIVDNVVTLTVSEADADKIKSAFPEVKISDKATISPALDVEQDFSEPIEYTVTAEDGKTKTTYTVKTLVAASSKAEILTFGLKDVKVLSSVVEGETVTLTVDDVDADKIKEAIPVATLSAGATISPDLDVAQDFTLPVEYTITAEDNTTKATYIVTVILYKQPKVIAFDFSTSTEKYKHLKSKNKSGLPVAQDNFIWDSSDGGFKFIFGFGLTDRYGVSHLKSDSELDEPAFQLETQYTGGNSLVPAITAGTLFSGVFDLNIWTPLKSTKFGVLTKNKPLSVSGMVSYKAGEKYFVCEDINEPSVVKEDSKIVDSGIISAIVYEVAKDSDTLDGTNVNTSNKIIAVEQFVVNNTDSTRFTLTLNYSKEFDAKKKYKLAFIASASKAGDTYSGAPGSLMKISELQFTFE